jgi:anti-anti-sigma regulatory factor
LVITTQLIQNTGFYFWLAASLHQLTSILSTPLCLFMPATLRPYVSLPRVYTVDFDQVDTVQLATRLFRSDPRQRPQFLIDCHHLACLRTRGVSYLVSQLLLTKRAGADLLLYNVDAVLGKALRVLQLHRVFQILPATS